MSRKDGKQVEEEPWAGRIPSDCEVWLRKENYGDSITFENPGERDACFMDFFMGNKNFSGFLYQLANGVYHVCSFY
ncbi:MAG: hypothetical protein HRT63_12730, partial [Erythrobacter sp.]|nr:hypothetical protein [Erythrobacter sp.]